MCDVVNCAAANCACVGLDLFLPAPKKRNRPEKRSRLPHPFHSLARKRNGKGYCRNVKQKDASTQYLSSSQILEEISTYISNLSRENCCISIQGEARKCNCFQFLADKPNIVKYVALGLKNYFDFDEQSRKFFLVNEQRHADRLLKHSNSPLRYQLPIFIDRFVGNEDDDFYEDLNEAISLSICHSAWTTVYNMGRKASEKIKSIVEGNQSMVHGNNGKRHVDEDREKAFDEIVTTLSDLQENHSMPFATRIVKDTTGHSSMRDNNECVYLPPSFSKRQCYLGICDRSGWKPVWVDRGKCKFKPISDWKPRNGFFRTEDEAIIHGDGDVVQPIVSWRSFRRCWARKFPKLKVRAKGEDTCADCYMLKLRLDRIAKEKADLLDQLDDDEIDGITPEDLAEQIEGYDEVILECKKHFEMHVAQREEFNSLKVQSKSDLAQGLPLHLMTMLLVIDMGQNAATPYLGGDQFGDFYYMTPLTHLIFGVACPAEEHMNTYIWEESVANRGADNIISCLYMDLVRRGVIGNTGRPLKHLAVAADNCSGQNKNKAMIKFCTFLVEAGWVEKFTLLFLVKGHTKNDCDRNFNLLKQGQDGEDIWTADELDAALTKKNREFIDLLRVPEEHWKGWTAGLNDYYRDPPSGTILSNHIFTFGDSDSPTAFRRQEYRDSDVIEEFDLYPTSRSKKTCVGLTADERAEDLINLPDCLDILPPPGLTAEKANECQNKLRPFAPTEEAKQYYNRMTREHQEAIDEKTAAKNKLRNEKKRAKKAKIAEANKDNR